MWAVGRTGPPADPVLTETLAIGRSQAVILYIGAERPTQTCAWRAPDLERAGALTCT